MSIKDYIVNNFKNDNNDLLILSSKYTKLYIENPELFSTYIIGGKSNKFLDKCFKDRTSESIKVDIVLTEGKKILNTGEYAVFVPVYGIYCSDLYGILHRSF